MPGYKVHLIIGFITAAVALFGLNYFQDHIPFISTEISGLNWAILVLIVFLYAQLPDIDADASKINKIWNTSAGILAILAIVFDKYKWAAVFAIASIVVLEWVQHRGFTHDLWFGALLSAPIALYNPLFAIVAFIVYISHLIADGQFGK